MNILRAEPQPSAEHRASYEDFANQRSRTTGSQGLYPRQGPSWTILGWWTDSWGVTMMLERRRYSLSRPMRRESRSILSWPTTCTSACLELSFSTDAAGHPSHPERSSLSRIYNRGWKGFAKRAFHRCIRCSSRNAGSPISELRRPCCNWRKSSLIEGRLPLCHRQ